MITPMTPTDGHGDDDGEEEVELRHGTVLPKSVISGTIIMMVMKAPNMKSSPKAKLMSSMMP